MDKVRTSLKRKNSKQNSPLKSPIKLVAVKKGIKTENKTMSSPKLSCKSDKKVVKMDKISKNESGYKSVKSMIDHFMKKSGAGLSTDKPSEVEAKKVVEDIESFEKENSVRELKNAFEILMKNGGDTQQKTPRKRLKRLVKSSAKKRY